MSGVCILVGAGPGDPGLITVRGLEAIRQADVIVADRLGTEALLSERRADAVLIDAGKAPGKVALTQDEINRTLVEHVSAGRRVVRLKGGDPFVFGRGGEEIEALVAEGLAVEVVPGITSAIGASAYAGIPVTHRGVATSFTVVTGHEDPTKPSAQTDWEALARVPGTLVILMGMGRLAEISARLIAAGRPADQPAAVVQWGTTTRHRQVRAPLDRIASVASEAGLGSPSVVIVGDVVGLGLDWLQEARPLLGRRVVVTRARAQASELRVRLEALGAEVIEVPAIRIAPIAASPQIDAAVAQLVAGHYAFLVLTSANGVECLLARLAVAGHDSRGIPATCRVVAIGPGTSAALAGYGIRADITPERSVAEGVLDALAGADVEGAHVLIARAAVGRDAIPEGLRARGAIVDDVAVYETLVEAPDPDLLARVPDADWLAFTASSTVDALVALLGDRQHEPTARPRVVSIGPITSDAVRAVGMVVDAEAFEHSLDGLVAALVHAERAANVRRGSPPA